MVGIRRTDGAAGCPPTATPPTSYVSPFKVDSAGALWVTSCFRDLRFLGSARHDIPRPIVIGQAGGEVSSYSDISKAGRGIVGGTYKSVTVTNDGDGPMGILIGHDVGMNITSRASNVIKAVVASYWNGVYHTLSDVSTMGIISDAAPGLVVTQSVWASANPHDVGIESGTGPRLVVQPGETAVVSARLYIMYLVGAADGTETLNSGISALRVYGYNL